ncbi:iron-sulfur cluster-binding protein [Photobacterium atrarenae]|uniref:FAD-binding oxidoreductase n=1 Tax=Photobacterium atrarenae TaxID=865757 RepID=A0ABY5GMY9_9GAMM|nr:FAD-binding oxidoreductase [Photobacterium atrarenae]UTV30511.1 FAD-binding oxidoreductase [Photobacterium atrarenae]
MHNLTPSAIELVDFYDDGEQARHFQFRLLDGAVSASADPALTEPTLTKQDTGWQKVQIGQFFMLNVPGVGEAPFTFTQMPDEQGHFRALVRQMGAVTTALFGLQPGQILGARGPYGIGWPMNEISGKRILVVGGGCGLAPLVGVVDHLVEQQNYTQLTVVYGARSQQAKMLNPERERWQQFIPVFNMIENGDLNGDENEYHGRPIDIMPTVLDSFGELPDVVLLAGPQVMMFGMADYLVASGVYDHAIYLSIERRMHCGLGTCGHCYLKHQYICTDGPTFRWDVLQPYLPEDH